MQGVRTLPATPWATARYVALVLLGVAGALILASLAAGVIATPAGDVRVYWDAAERLRDGQPLYGGDDPRIAYRYAPWFAFAWVPLTFLPRPLVEAAWVAVQLGAMVYVLRPWVGPALLILGPALLYAAVAGNVHPLMLAGLAYGLPRRSGPLFLALAASLKAFPLLLVTWYIGRREWRKAAWALGLTALLVAPMLLFDVGSVTDAGRTLSLYAVAPVLWAAVALAAAVVAVRYAGTRYGLLWAGAAVMAALPRLLFYDLGYLALSRPTPVSPGPERKSGALRPRQQQPSG